MLYMGTLDAKLVALDAKTGKIAWEVQIADPEKGYSETMAPTVVDGKVLIGHQAAAEYGIRGFLKAFDARTGKLLWTFYTIPDKGHEGVWAEKTTPPAGNMKRDIAAEKKQLAGKGDRVLPDARRRRMDDARGRPQDQGPCSSSRQSLADLYGAERPGDNLYTDSIVAIDLDSGKYKWHFQYIAHDVWDLDAVSPPILGASKGQGRQDGRCRDPRRENRPRLRARAQHGQADPLFGSDDPAGKHVGVADREGRAHAPRGERRGRVVADGIQPEERLAYALNLHQPMTYHVEAANYPGGSKLWLGGAFKAIADEKQWGRLAAVNVDTGKWPWKYDTEQPLIGRRARHRRGSGVPSAKATLFQGGGRGRPEACCGSTRPGPASMRLRCPTR